MGSVRVVFDEDASFMVVRQVDLQGAATPLFEAVARHCGCAWPSAEADLPWQLQFRGQVVRPEDVLASVGVASGATLRCVRVDSGQSVAGGELLAAVAVDGVLSTLARSAERAVHSGGQSAWTSLQRLWQASDPPSGDAVEETTLSQSVDGRRAKANGEENADVAAPGPSASVSDLLSIWNRVWTPAERAQLQQWIWNKSFTRAQVEQAALAMRLVSDALLGVCAQRCSAQTPPLFSAALYARVRAVIEEEVSLPPPPPDRHPAPVPDAQRPVRAAAPRRRRTGAGPLGAGMNRSPAAFPTATASVSGYVPHLDAGMVAALGDEEAQRWRVLLARDYRTLQRTATAPNARSAVYRATGRSSVGL